MLKPSNYQRAMSIRATAIVHCSTYIHTRVQDCTVNKERRLYSRGGLLMLSASAATRIGYICITDCITHRMARSVDSWKS